MPNTQPHSGDPKIGIVIPAHNEADNISACLDAIKQATVSAIADYSGTNGGRADGCDDDTFIKVQNADRRLDAVSFANGKIEDLGVRRIEQRAGGLLTDADSMVGS